MSLLRSLQPLVVVCALAIAAVPVASAHHAEVFEHGRLFLELEMVEGGCAITVTGRHMGAPDGTLRFFAAPEGPEGEQLLLEADVEASPEDGGDGWMFVAGPFSDFGHDGPDWVTFYFEVDSEEHATGLILNYEGCRDDDLVYAYDPETGDRACTFVIEGSHLVSPEGYVLVRAGQDEIRRIEVEPEAEEQGAGWQFVTGPVTLNEDGRYTVRFVYSGNDTTYDSSLPDGFDLSGCGPDRVPPDECSSAEQARPVENGAIELNWVTPDNANGTRIERAQGDGDFETIVLLDTGEYEEHTFVDEGTQAGVTYRYMIVAFNDAGDSTAECDVLEVTAVPFFGGPLLSAFALAACVGGYAWFARRRA